MSSSSSSTASSSSSAPAFEAASSPAFQLDLSTPSSPVYRTVAPFSPSNSSALTFPADQPIYRGTTLVEDSYPSSWDEPQSLHAKDLSLPSLYPSSAPSYKVDLPDVRVLPTQTRPLSPVPAVFDRSFAFTSSLTAASLPHFFPALLTAPSFPYAVSPVKMHPRHASLAFSVRHRGSTVSVAVNMFAYSPFSSLVEVQRRCGDVLLFQAVYQAVVDGAVEAGHFEESMAPAMPRLSDMSPPALSPSSTSSSASDLSMDMDDEALDAEVAALLLQQATQAEHYHTRDAALHTLASVPSFALTSEEDAMALFTHAASSASGDEREDIIDMVVAFLATVPLSSPLLAALAPLLVDALTANTGSVWWRRGLTKALTVCAASEKGQAVIAQQQPKLQALIRVESDAVVKSNLEEMFSS